MGEGVELPRALVECLAEFPSAERQSWVERLPETIDRVADRWGVTVGMPFQPGGMVSWVAPARTARGEEVVVKVGWGHPDAQFEAEALRAWDGRGAVRLHDAWVFEDTCALLLERCMPGTSLADLPGFEQDEVVAGVLVRLWEAATGGPFRSLLDMCREWAAEFEEKVEAGGVPGGPDDPLDARAVSDGMALYLELAATAPTTALLCTDLHAGNVLAAQREPWLAIDPKPHLGDPTYDTVQHMLNGPARLASDPLAFADRMADLAGLDRGRQRQWLLARCVQESVDTPALGAVARRLLAVT